MKKVFGVILIVIGVLLTPPTLINLSTSLNELVDLIKKYSAYSFGHFTGSFVITSFTALITFLCYRYGIKLLRKKKVDLVKKENDENISLQ